MVYSAGMPAVGVVLPAFLVRNVFQALKLFLAWVAERTGRLKVITEALRLVSSSQLSNVKLVGWGEIKTGNPVLCLWFD